jgi:hypothetical protein
MSFYDAYSSQDFVAWNIQWKMICKWCVNYRLQPRVTVMVGGTEEYWDTWSADRDLNPRTALHGANAQITVLRLAVRYC